MKVQPPLPWHQSTVGARTDPEMTSKHSNRCGGKPAWAHQTSCLYFRRQSRGMELSKFFRAQKFVSVPYTGHWTTGFDWHSMMRCLVWSQLCPDTSLWQFDICDIFWNLQEPTVKTLFLKRTWTSKMFEFFKEWGIFKIILHFILW